MNARIKELLDQCINKDMPDKPWPLIDSEKFAELIVKECFTKLTPYIDEFGINDVEAELKEHFGIKE